MNLNRDRWAASALGATMFDTWIPLDLEMEVPPQIWAGWLADISEWNRLTFGSQDPWVDLTQAETVDALEHFGLRPLVRGLRREGAGPTEIMSFHWSPLRQEASGLGSNVRPEILAITISDGQIVRFALAQTLPEQVLRIAKSTIEVVHMQTNRDLARSGIVLEESNG